MKSRRSPLAVAAAVLVAAPPVSAQPLQLTPPPRSETPVADAAPAATPAQEGEGDLRGRATPLPQELALAPGGAPAPDPPPTAMTAPTETAAPATPASAAPPAQPQARAPQIATVSVGVRDDYTRLVFRFPGPTTVTPLLRSDRLDLRFSRGADIDLAELRAGPPRFVREARRTSAPGAPVRVQLTLDPGVRQRHFTDGDRVVIDLLPPAPGTQRAPAEPSAPAPAPANGTARVELVEQAEATRITVNWPEHVRAAAFRRGEAIWLLFDATGRIDVGGVARVGRRHRDVQVVRGEGVLGLRLPAPPDVQVSASPGASGWVFTLAARAAPNRAADVAREIGADGRARLMAQFGHEGVVRWLSDPEIGDRFAVGLIPGPALGIDMRRATVEAALLPSAHGAVIEPRADGVTATFDQGALVVTRGEGLLAAAPMRSELEAGLNAALIESALSAPSGADAPSMGLAQIRERIDQLSREAAAEGVEEGAPVEARMALARFLLEHDFAAEALGALRLAAVNQGELIEVDPEFRLMRGAANVMMGRMDAAMADLGVSSLADSPAAALWRGYAAALEQNWADARRELEAGASGLEQHPPAWRARFQLALARAALELNDLATAEAAARAASGQSRDAALGLHAQLIHARIAAARGETQAALAAFDEIARGVDEEVAVRASVEAIRVRRAVGLIRPVDAIEPLEALRFRWRGDSTEIAIVGLLGDVYSELGRWRDALATMRVAAERFPADPATRQLRADMSTLFERLFLDGEADGLDAIQALGLFYEFSDLTPIGPNGDRIVRLLAGRLVHVDLLEQAAQLLQHQVNERLDGIGKAQVAADLAAIYLMDRKPDQALVALAMSRQPNMPPELQAERRMLEARALLDLGRFDNAVEMVERDRSEEGQRVRAEAAWRSRDWLRAAAELRTLLGMRERAQPLDAEARQTVLRTSVALTLAGDEGGVRALYREHAGDMSGTPEADAFEVVAGGIHADSASVRDVARAVARTDLLDRFMQRLRARMTAEAGAGAATSPTAPAPAGPTPQPQAALPPPQRPGAGA